MIRNVLMSLALGAMVPAMAQANTLPCNGDQVRVINPMGGGLADLLSRLVLEKVSAKTGQTFVIDPVTGASGTIGLAEMVQAAPDGCTLGVINSASVVVSPIVMPEVPYDPIADISPIAYLGGAAYVLTVRSGLDVHDVDTFVEFLRDPKEHPTFGTMGMTTGTTAVMMHLGNAMGGTFTIVPYPGVNAALADVAGGHVDFTMLSYASQKGQIEAGTIRPIAVGSDLPMEALPGVPTLAEAGYADLVTPVWFAIGGPKGLPEEMVQELNAEIAAALSDPAVLERFNALNLLTLQATPAELAAKIAAEIDALGPIVRELSMR
jgi:tripartite-type tricarboxylate transporter receptor subunit TctC